MFNHLLLTFKSLPRKDIGGHHKYPAHRATTATIERMASGQFPMFYTKTGKVIGNVRLKINNEWNDATLEHLRKADPNADIHAWREGGYRGHSRGENTRGYYNMKVRNVMLYGNTDVEPPLVVENEKLPASQLGQIPKHVNPYFEDFLKTTPQPKPQEQESNFLRILKNG